jgi:hypothetical protein
MVVLPFVLTRHEERWSWGGRPVSRPIANYKYKVRWEQHRQQAALYLYTVPVLSVGRQLYISLTFTEFFKCEIFI